MEWLFKIFEQYLKDNEKEGPAAQLGRLVIACGLVLIFVILLVGFVLQTH